MNISITFFIFLSQQVQIKQGAQMDNNHNVDETTELQASGLFESIQDRQSQNGSSQKKTKEKLSEDLQGSQMNEQSRNKSISRQEQRQSSIASSSHLTIEQKQQEINNLRNWQPKNQQRAKMAKEIEYLQQQNELLRQQMKSYEQASQTLHMQLGQKEKNIEYSSKKIEYFQRLLADEIKDIQNNNKRITDLLLSDLQMAVSTKAQRAEQQRSRLLMDYVKKEDYQRLNAQKIELEEQLKGLKKEDQSDRNRSSQTAQIQKKYSELQRENAENKEMISKLKKELGLKDDEIQEMANKLSQKQAVNTSLVEQLQSLEVTSTSQMQLNQQLLPQNESLKAFNANLQKKCFEILSQTNDTIFLQFSDEINSFTEQLEKINQENKYLKKQLVTLKTIELTNERDRMMKDIDLTFARQKIFLCQAVIKEKQYQATDSILTIQNVLKMKNDELEALSNNIKCLEKIIQDNTTFYSTLISSKYAQWKIINKLNDDKTKNLETIISIREQNMQDVVQKLNNLESAHEQQKRKSRQAYKQEIARSENEVMELQSQIDLIKQQFELNFKEKEKLTTQNGLMSTLIKLIEKNHENVHNLITEIEKINQDHIFDGIATVFLSLNDKSQNQERQIATHLSALSKLQQKDAQLQSEERVRQSAFQEKDLLLVFLTNQLKQKEKIIQQLQEKTKKSSESNTLVKQYQSKIEQYRCQLDDKIKQIQNLHKQNSNLKVAIDNHSQQIQKYQQEKNNLQDKIADLSNQVFQLSSQIEKAPKYPASQKSTPSQDRQLQSLKKKYEQLQEELSDANKLNNMMSQIEQTNRSTIEDLEREVARLNQRLKRPSNASQLLSAERERPAANNTLSFFTLKSVIETSKGGKQFVVKSVEDYCSREVKGIQMVFRKDESNNNTFQSSFKPTDLAESICLFLFRKPGNIFGIVTFPEVFKGSPSAFLVSVTNKKCVYKSEERNEKAFVYDSNTITIGKNQIRIKSGFKNMTISDVVFRGYFESYVKSDIFGPEFKEVSEIDNFEIHKINV